MPPWIIFDIFHSIKFYEFCFLLPTPHQHFYYIIILRRLIYVVRSNYWNQSLPPPLSPVACEKNTPMKIISVSRVFYENVIESSGIFVAFIVRVISPKYIIIGFFVYFLHSKNGDSCSFFFTYRRHLHNITPIITYNMNRNDVIGYKCSWLFQIPRVFMTQHFFFFLKIIVEIIKFAENNPSKKWHSENVQSNKESRVYLIFSWMRYIVLKQTLLT